MKPAARGIVLVGFMGAGKSSVGGALARRLGWRFVDLDERIRQRAGRTIAQIFHGSGEAEFRRLETEALRGLLREMASTNIVAALGGGAPAQEENARLLATAGVTTVFLDATVGELWRRVREKAPGADAERPLARDAEVFRRLYAGRRASYLAAPVRVDTEGRQPDEVATEIVSRLALQ